MAHSCVRYRHRNGTCQAMAPDTFYNQNLQFIFTSKNLNIYFNYQQIPLRIKNITLTKTNVENTLTFSNRLWQWKYNFDDDKFNIFELLFIECNEASLTDGNKFTYERPTTEKDAGHGQKFIVIILTRDVQEFGLILLTLIHFVIHKS